MNLVDGDCILQWSVCHLIQNQAVFKNILLDTKVFFFILEDLVQQKLCLLIRVKVFSNIKPILLFHISCSKHIPSMAAHFLWHLRLA